MMSSSSWIYENYERLTKEYSGLCVLIRDQKVVFADKKTDVVLKYAMEKYPDRDWGIARIDSGEAALYGLYI